MQQKPFPGLFQYSEGLVNEYKALQIISTVPALSQAPLCWEKFCPIAEEHGCTCTQQICWNSAETEEIKNKSL